MSDNFQGMVPPDRKKSLNWEGGCLWSGIGVVLGGVALGLVFLIGTLTRISKSNNISEPEITVIMPPASTSTQIPSASEESGQDQTPMDPEGTQAGANFVVGDFVEIFGTGGQGLSIRNQPGLSSVVGFYGLDDEVFEVKGGPVEADGFVWWYLINPYDDSKQGWGVGEYLRRPAQ